MEWVATQAVEEGVPQFVARAVDAQVQRDTLSRKIGAI